MNNLRRMAKNWSGSSITQKLFAGLLILLFCAGICKAVYYTRLFGGADLRERIVGARVLNTPHSPYYYKWLPGDGEELMNPNLNRQRNISGLSVAPGTLYIHYLFSPLYYPVLRMVWLVVQYLLLGYILLFFLRASAYFRQRMAVALAGVLFFACSPFWLLHIDRGQVYILYAFFFCVAYQWYKSQLPVKHFAAGLLVAMAVYCRPTFAVVVLPFLFTRNRRFLSGVVAGAAMGCAGLLLNGQLWRDYFTAITAFTQVSAGLRFSDAAKVEYPLVIEGMANLQAGKLDFMTGGVLPLDARLGRLGITLPGSYYVFIYAGLAILMVRICLQQLKQGSAVTLALVGFALYILTEFIMPAPRGAYNLVQWIFPVLLMLSSRSLSPQNILAIAIGLCFMVDFPFYFPFFNDIGELLLFFTTIKFIREYPGPPASLQHLQ